ncbi:hypothetical protein [Vibrio parahaemolyticus]|uniref:hypothetical protein n=1 Tax=Vibrio parahaemolyticus TaxID=670 RepID=UPI003892ACF7
METLLVRQEKFLANLIKKHGNKLDVSMVDYVNYDSPVRVRCPMHGVFEMKPRHLLKHAHPCELCRALVKVGQALPDGFPKEINAEAPAHQRLLVKVFRLE